MLGRQQYHQDSNVTKGKILTMKERKLQGEKSAKLLTDHTFTKHRKLVQDTKKGCFIVFNTKKLFTFPGYKIPTDSRYNRDKAAKSVKKNSFFFRIVKGPKRKSSG